MYGIFTNIYPINFPNVGKYTIHGAFGIQKMWKTDVSPTKMIYISGGFSKSMLVYRCTCWNGGFCVWYEKWKGWGWHLDFFITEKHAFHVIFSGSNDCFCLEAQSWSLKQNICSINT
jgi:hypothetical protein